MPQPLTAKHKCHRLTSVEHIVSHPGLTDIVSTISLPGIGQLHGVKGWLCKVTPFTSGDPHGSLKEKDFWSWETVIDTLDVN